MTNTAYPDKKATDVVEVPCTRCGGGAAATDWGYGNISNVLAFDGKSTGRYCFKCAGRGTVTTTVGAVRKAARAAARRDAKRAAEAEARQAAEAEAVAAQAAREARIAAEREAERLAAEPCPTGRVVITGEIVSLRREESNFGYRATMTTKMLVKDDRGFKVWGTMPNTLADDLYYAWYEAAKAEAGEAFTLQNFGSDYWFKSAKGSRITFTATVTPSDRDDRFGFAKRPTKAEVLG